MGPAIGPIIAGFVSPMNWRRQYWVALILAGVSCIPLLFLPGTSNSPYLMRSSGLKGIETYGPVLYARRAQADRAWVGQSTEPTPLVSRKQNIRKTLSVALVRPFRMVFEPIVLATSLFMAVSYAVWYLFFEAYPIIFGGKKHHPVVESTSHFIPSSCNS